MTQLSNFSFKSNYNIWAASLPSGDFPPLQHRILGNHAQLYDFRLGVSLLARSPTIEYVVINWATTFEMGRLAQSK